MDAAKRIRDLLNFIAYCKDLSEQEIVALRAGVELFPSKNKTKR